MVWSGWVVEAVIYVLVCMKKEMRERIGPDGFSVLLDQINCAHKLVFPNSTKVTMVFSGYKEVIAVINEPILSVFCLWKYEIDSLHYKYEITIDI